MNIRKSTPLLDAAKEARFADYIRDAHWQLGIVRQCHEFQSNWDQAARQQLANFVSGKQHPELAMLAYALSQVMVTLPDCPYVEMDELYFAMYQAMINRGPALGRILKHDPQDNSGFVIRSFAKAYHGTKHSADFITSFRAAIGCPRTITIKTHFEQTSPKTVNASTRVLNAYIGHLEREMIRFYRDACLPKGDRQRDMSSYDFAVTPTLSSLVNWMSQAPALNEDILLVLAKYWLAVSLLDDVTHAVSLGDEDVNSPVRQRLNATSSLQDSYPRIGLFSSVEGIVQNTLNRTHRSGKAYTLGEFMGIRRRASIGDTRGEKMLSAILNG